MASESEGPGAGPLGQPELTFEEREAAARVMWVITTYLTAFELKGQRRPDYIKAMHDMQHAIQSFRVKLDTDRAQAETAVKVAARKGRVDDSGWTNDHINHELAAMAELLKGLNGKAQES